MRFERDEDAIGVLFPLSETQEQAALEALLHETPHAHGIAQTRWRLRDIARCIPWLEQAPEGTVCAILKRLGFSHKQPEHFQRSPDPDYESKNAAIRTALGEVMADPLHNRLFYLDEFTYYRRPTLKRLYQRRGRTVRRLVDRAGANTRTRIGGLLDAVDGSTITVQRSSVGVREVKILFKRLAKRVQDTLPSLKRLVVVLDNWPVHHHATVTTLAAELGITLLYLPTYASWLNPIERLWRWLRQDITHSHPWAANPKLAEIRSHTKAWLAARSDPSPLTLFRTGLISHTEYETRRTHNPMST